MAAVGGIAISAAAPTTSKVKNVAKKSTTKPPGFTRNLVRNGSYDSSNAPSPASNGSSDSQRASPAVVEINGKASPSEITQLCQGNGEQACGSEDSSQKGAPLPGSGEASCVATAEQETKESKDIDAEVSEHTPTCDNPASVKADDNSDAIMCLTSETDQTSKQTKVSSLINGPSPTTDAATQEIVNNEKKENKTEVTETLTSTHSNEITSNEIDKCDSDTMDSIRSNSGSSNRNVLSLANIKDSFKGIIKKAVSKIASGSDSPVPESTVDSDCASPDSVTRRVDKGNVFENLSNSFRSTGSFSDLKKDSDNAPVKSPKAKEKEEMEKLEKEIEMELDNTESGNLDDVDDSILEDSYDDKDKKFCDTATISEHIDSLKTPSECEDSKTHEEKSKLSSNASSNNSEANDSKVDKFGKDIVGKSNSTSGKACAKEETQHNEVQHIRKRAASSDAQTVDNKKSRLDCGVGTTGTRTSSKPEDTLLNEAGDSPVEKETSLGLGNGFKEEMDSCTNSTVNSNKYSNKVIKITKKSLDKIVAKRLTEYLNSTQDCIIKNLRRRVSELSSSNEAWKAQVLELKKQIIDITVIHQRHERRRATPARVQSRNMSIQVDEAKIEAAKQGLVQEVSGSKAAAGAGQQPTPPRAPGPGAGARAGQVSLAAAPPAGTTQTMLIPVASGGGVTPGQAVTLLAPSSLPPASANLASQIRMQLASPPIMEQAKNPNQTVREMLELKKKTTQVTTTSTITAGQSILARSSGGSIIDLTGDDDLAAKARSAVMPGAMPTMSLPQGMIRPGMSITGLQPGTFVLRQASAGAPMILQPISQVRTAAPGTTVLYTSRPSGPLVMSGNPGTTMTRMSTLAPTPSASTQAQPVPQQTLRSPPTNARTAPKHPAPLPVIVNQKVVPGKPLPPKPTLKINRVQQGIVLSWNMTVSEGLSDVTNYQLYAYQEGAATPTSTLWKKVGDVKALPLPMACTLTQFQVGNKYHFAVRAADSFGRAGPFSDPGSIHLDKR